MVDGSPNSIPNRRDTLPLIHQDGWIPAENLHRISLSDRPMCRIVQADDRTSPALGSGGLADSLGAFKHDRRKFKHQLIKFSINQPSQIFRHDSRYVQPRRTLRARQGHTEHTAISAVYTMPFTLNKRY